MTDIINTELGIAVAGSADSGKSTFIGVLTTGELDNGDGSARLQIARHQHEVKSKKTSSISTKTIITQNKKKRVIKNSSLQIKRPFRVNSVEVLTSNDEDYTEPR